MLKAASVAPCLISVALLLAAIGCSDDDKDDKGEKQGSGGSEAAAGSSAASGSSSVAGGGSGQSGGSANAAAVPHCEKWFRKCGPGNELGIDEIEVKNFTDASGCQSYYSSSSAECRECMDLHMTMLNERGDMFHCYHTAGEGVGCGCRE